MRHIMVVLQSMLFLAQRIKATTNSGSFNVARIYRTQQCGCSHMQLHGLTSSLRLNELAGKGRGCPRTTSSRPSQTKERVSLPHHDDERTAHHHRNTLFGLSSKKFCFTVGWDDSMTIMTLLFSRRRDASPLAAAPTTTAMTTTTMTSPLRPRKRGNSISPHSSNNNSIGGRSASMDTDHHDDNYDKPSTNNKARKHKERPPNAILFLPCPYLTTTSRTATTTTTTMAKPNPNVVHDLGSWPLLCISTTLCVILAGGSDSASSLLLSTWMGRNTAEGRSSIPGSSSSLVASLSAGAAVSHSRSMDAPSHVAAAGSTPQMDDRPMPSADATTGPPVDHLPLVHNNNDTTSTVTSPVWQHYRNAVHNDSGCMWCAHTCPWLP